VQRGVALPPKVVSPLDQHDLNLRHELNQTLKILGIAT